MNGSVILWIVWLALAISLTWTGLRWEGEYFRSPGPHFYRLLLLLLCASPLILAAYHRLRRAWFEWEPLIVLATLAAGRQIRIVLGLRPDGPVEEIVAASVLGFGALNCVLFLLLGLAGLYTAGVLAALFTAALLPGSLLVLFGLALIVTATMRFP